MEIRRSTIGDLPEMMWIYAFARKFMEKHGNPRQWGLNNWPPEELIFDDIEKGKSYVVVEKGMIVGTFYFDYGKDIEPTYAVIENGEWLDDSAYGVVHRLAGNGSVKGIGKAALDYAIRKSKGHVRVDTNPDNKVLQNMLEKQKFIRRGFIHVTQDNDPRYAYEFMGEYEESDNTEEE